MDRRIRVADQSADSLMLTCSKGKPILVPMTTSLYVPGTLANFENVIVDVGTGFYVEKVKLLLISLIPEAYLIGIA